ncbi:MAG: hypothetical protein R3C59_03335 [Planctomycetaceae bacterium]
MSDPMATQSEQVLEDNLVARLIALRDVRADVTDEASMLANLKAQLEAYLICESAKRSNAGLRWLEPHILPERQDAAAPSATIQIPPTFLMH